MRIPKLNDCRPAVIAIAIVCLAVLLLMVVPPFFKGYAPPQKPASVPADAGNTAAAKPDTSKVQQQQQQPFHYPIQLGDRLWFIAEASCATPLEYRAIAKLNHISNPDWIVAGKDVLAALPRGCSPQFKPRRVVVANHARSATADSETSSTADPADPAPASAPAPATQWHMPTYTYTYTWQDPAVVTAEVPQPTTTDAVINSTPTASTPKLPPPTTLADTTLPKSGGFWTVRFTAEQTQKQWAGVKTGTFFALALGEQQQNGRWEGRWKHRRKTLAVVRRNDDGTMDVSVWLKKPPQSGTVVALIPGTDGMLLPSDMLLGQGAPAAGIPTLGKDPDERAHEKILCATFKKEPNLAVRGILKVGVPVARTAVGYAMGGPILATLVNVPGGLKWMAGKFTPSVAVPQQNAAAPTEQPATETQPAQ